MDCLRKGWNAGKTCCGPKTFYTVVAVVVGTLLLAACLAIAIPIHLRDEQEVRAIIRALPALPAATVQVQGASHSLVHFQEGIDVGGKDGSPRIGGPIRHWGLVLAVGGVVAGRDHRVHHRQHPGDYDPEEVGKPRFS